MGRPKRRIFTNLMIFLLLSLAFVAAAYSSAPVRGRAHILSRKVSGSLPYVNWSELFKALLPRRWEENSPPPGYFVKEKARGEEPCPVLWDTPQGAFWGQPHDSITLQDPQHLARYQAGPVTIRSGDVVFDIGSQIGTFTRLALRKGAGKVIAIEPDPTNNACFKRTFEKEIAEGQVILIEAALWDSVGVMKFAVASRSDAGAVASEFDSQFKATRMVDVPTATLDDIVQKRNLSRVDFIKWAIGGATRPALRGAHQTLSRFRPRMAMAMLIDSFSDHSVELPLAALEAVPTYNVFTHKLLLVYFY